MGTISALNDTPDASDATSQVPTTPTEPVTVDASPVVVESKFPKWPVVLVGVLMLFGIAAAIAWPINLPYYALAPGPVYDVDDFVVIDDADVPTGGLVEGESAAGGEGELFFLTVSLAEVNLFEYIGGLIDESVDLRPREVIRPTGVSQDDLRRQNIDLMVQSQQDAIFVALTKLGYEVTFSGEGARIIEVTPGSAAEGVLEPEDIIVEVDGEPIQFSTEAVEQVGGRAVGETLTLKVNRPINDTEFETFEVSVTLGPHIDDPERGMIGVLLTNARVDIDFPVDVVIDSQNIGGPSAGMMFTLEIIDLLDEGDLTKGHRIAGTGTINTDGDVGAIGGIRQKVFAAIDAGADYVLVPLGNFDDAADAAGDRIDVIPVAHIDEALEFLANL